MKFTRMLWSRELDLGFSIVLVVLGCVWVAGIWLAGRFKDIAGS